MLMAWLSGKLSREQENMEDLLTSTVFGLLKYCSEDLVLLPFLRLARTSEGVNPLADLCASTTAQYEFWPQWQEPSCEFCEPDVVLRLESPDGRRRLVAVEVKFRADKSADADASEVPPTDQLAKEWDNLVSRARAEDSEPVLLYLTADFGCPVEAIEDSRAEYRSKRGVDPVIAWLSWSQLHRVVTDRGEPVLRDLGELLTKLGLEGFQGIAPIPPLLPLSWSFDDREHDLEWPVVPRTAVTWRFVT